MKKTKNKEINRKFVLVGDGFCGKSTLINAFYTRKFVDKYEPTIFDTFTITTDIYKKNVELEIMDSAGQEEFSRVRPLSYPEVDCIILCFSVDSRESSQNIIEQWIPEINHYCDSKIPIVLVGCKIDLRYERPNINNHLLLKQEHLNNLNNRLTNDLNLKNNQDNSSIKSINSSLNHGFYKTLALYCCRHGRLCTCYHSRICATNCLNIKRKPNQLSNSTSYLLTATSTKTLNNNGLKSPTQTSLVDKDNITRCNRMLLELKSPSKHHSNMEEDSNFSGLEDNEELSNTMSNSSCSLNCVQDKSSLTSSNNYNNSIYRHNQSMLNALIHQQVAEQQQQCNRSLNNHSLNSSESDESEINDNQADAQNHEDDEFKMDHHLPSLPVNHHLQSSIEESAKSQPNLIKNLSSNNRTRLWRGYKSFVNTDNRSMKSQTKLKDKCLFKNSSLKQKLGTILGYNSSANLSSSIYPCKSERKLHNLLLNRKLSTSNSNLPFSLPLIYKSKTETNLKINDKQSIPLITTEEGIRLSSKIGASAYVECSSKMNIGVEDVFKTALRLTIKQPLRFSQLDMCSIS